jgi:hypothetical protein
MDLKNAPMRRRKTLMLTCTGKAPILLDRACEDFSATIESPLLRSWVDVWGSWPPTHIGIISELL